MRRININNIREAVKYLNKAAGYPETGLAQDKEGRLRPVQGAYVLDAAYGGYRLNRHTEGGEIHITARYPAKVTYDMIYAYVEGLEIGLAKSSGDTGQARII